MQNSKNWEILYIERLAWGLVQQLALMIKILF